MKAKSYLKKNNNPEGARSEPTLPDTIHSDPASSSSEWQKVDESETLPSKKKHNKMTIMTTTTLEGMALTEKDKDSMRGGKWL